MAEIRKHTERAEGLAAVVRAAIGGDVRPTTPGSEDDARPSVPTTVPGGTLFLTQGAEKFMKLSGRETDGMADAAE